MHNNMHGELMPISEFVLGYVQDTSVGMYQ